MQEKAIKNLVAQYNVDNNVVKGNICVFKKFTTLDYIVDIKFILNGVEYSLNYTVKYNDSISLSKDAFITSLYKEVSKVITEELLKNFDGRLENFSE